MPGLSRAELSYVFPFYIACAHDGAILEVGHSLARLAPKIKPGDFAFDHLRLVRPPCGPDMNALRQYGRGFVVFELDDPFVVLRGQSLVQSECILLLVSPWVTDLAQVSRLGLEIGDFAEHDPLLDYLMLLQSKNAALRESIAFGDELRDAKLRVESALAEHELVSRRLEALISRLPDGLLAEDEAGRVVLANERLLELLKVPGSPQALLGLDCRTAAQAAKGMFRDAEGFIAGIARRTSERKLVVREELPLMDGRILERDYVPIFDATTYRGHLWQYRDVTEQRNAALDLSLAREKAEAANEAKGAFLAMMSHEMRTPLAAVVGLCDLLSTEPDDAQRAAYLSGLTRNAQTLLELIEDILHFAKLEAGEVSLNQAPFSPRDLLDGLAADLALSTAERGLELHMELGDGVPAYLKGDSGRLRQVLANLAGNAVKFTHEGSVRVRLDATQVGPDQVTLSCQVSDTGPGIPAEQQERVFERFVRLEGAREAHVPGTGLGLSIVRALVSLMHGRLTLESELGRGSTFCVSLELPVVERADPALEDTHAAQASASAGPAHILLVEDDSDNRAIVSALLAREGHVVTTATHGLAGLEKSDAVPFDLILTDLQMPGVDGVQFAQRLREREVQEGWPRTALVAVSAHAVPVHRERALAAGIDAFVAKPASALSLRKLVAKWADRRPLVLALGVSGDSCQGLRSVLEATGERRLWAVRDMAAMLRVLDSHPAALIVVDLDAADMDGYEAVRALRERAGTTAPPIVALSANAGERETGRCVDAGCSTLLMKPVRQKLLEAVVTKLMDNAREAPQPGVRATRPSAPPLSALRVGYLARRVDDIKTVLACLVEGEPSGLAHAQTLAHNAKGTGGAYGCAWLSERAGRIEQAIAAGLLEDARTCAEALLPLLERERAEAERVESFRNGSVVPD